MFIVAGCPDSSFDNIDKFGVQRDTGDRKSGAGLEEVVNIYAWREKAMLVNIPAILNIVSYVTYSTCLSQPVEWKMDAIGYGCLLLQIQELVSTGQCCHCCPPWSYKFYRPGDMKGS